MHTSTPKLFVSILSAFLIASASAQDKACTETHSESWCILDIAGFSKGARDLTVAEANTSLSQSPLASTQSSSPVDAGSLVVAAIDLTKHTTIPLGMTANFSASMWLMNAFIDYKGAGQRRQLFVLLPESKVVGSDPNKTAEDAYIPAFAKVLGATSYEVQERTHQPTFGSATLVREYVFRGGRCIGSGCLLTAKFFQYPNSNLSKPQVVETPPAWFSAEKHYLWTSLSSYPLLIDDKKARIFKEEDWIQLFKHLPSWFYYYVPSSPAILLTGNDKMRLLVK